MGKRKTKKLKLLPHEELLLANGDLKERTHKGSTSRWLWAPSRALSSLHMAKDDEGDDEEGSDSNSIANKSEYTLVYRPMGDIELKYLLQHRQLPDTQPYQAIIEGADIGRVYAEKFLRGHKKVDTAPTTVVEFCTPKSLVDQLMSIQHKVEDGAISMGLGNKAGGGLSLFNTALSSLPPPCGFRIVLVKRRIV